MAKEKELQAREASVAAASSKNAESESKMASAEADLVKTQQERADLQNNLKQKEDEIAALHKRLDEAGGAKELMPDSLPMPGAGDLQTQLEETRKQLDSAEREKQLLADKIRNADRGPSMGKPRNRARPRRVILDLRGTVLAVNQAYNFVVLNLGGRAGHRDEQRNACSAWRKFDRENSRLLS